MDAETFREVRRAINEERPAAFATVIDGAFIGNYIALIHPDQVVGTLGSAELDSEVMDKLERALTDGSANAIELDGQRIYIEAQLPPPHMVIIGAVHTAIPLIGYATILGYKTTVIDARGTFATEERFPHVDRMIEAWPDEGLAQVVLHPGVAAVVLAHDPKFEDPAMEVLLRSDVGYIGAIGSRATSLERLDRLRGMGFSDADLDRIHGPVGLNLGGKSPEEIALSIVAEIIAVRNGKHPAQATAQAKAA
jgi:xanthine dehydrogenase accessory factor